MNDILAARVGRAAAVSRIKFRATGATQTGTNAGQISGESFTCVDVRSQINTVTQIVAAIAGAFMSGMNNAAAPAPH